MLLLHVILKNTRQRHSDTVIAYSCVKLKAIYVAHIFYIALFSTLKQSDCALVTCYVILKYTRQSHSDSLTPKTFLCHDVLPFLLWLNFTQQLYFLLLSCHFDCTCCSESNTYTHIRIILNQTHTRISELFCQFMETCHITQLWNQSSTTVWKTWTYGGIYLFVQWFVEPAPPPPPPMCGKKAPPKQV